MQALFDHLAAALVFHDKYTEMTTLTHSFSLYFSRREQRQCPTHYCLPPRLLPFMHIYPSSPPTRIFVHIRHPVQAPRLPRRMPPRSLRGQRQHHGVTSPARPRARGSLYCLHLLAMWRPWNVGSQRRLWWARIARDGRGVVSTHRPRGSRTPTNTSLFHSSTLTENRTTTHVHHSHLEV